MAVESKHGGKLAAIHDHIFCRQVGQSEGLYVGHAAAAPADLEHVHIAVHIFGDQDLHHIDDLRFCRFGCFLTGGGLFGRGFRLCFVCVQGSGSGLFRLRGRGGFFLRLHCLFQFVLFFFLPQLFLQRVFQRLVHGFGKSFMVCAGDLQNGCGAVRGRGCLRRRLGGLRLHRGFLCGRLLGNGFFCRGSFFRGSPGGVFFLSGGRFLLIRGYPGNQIQDVVGLAAFACFLSSHCHFSSRFSRRGKSRPAISSHRFSKSMAGLERGA